jgi:uncharacterized membrane protein YbhN (UPF0104 family)
MGIASHVSRAMRWQLVTASMGYHIGLGNSFMGVMIGYFANLAIPRIGEFTRCGVVSRYEKVPFSNLLGTVVAERLVDMLILLLLTLVVVVTQFKQVGIFLDNNPEVRDNLVSLLHSGWFLLFVGVAVVCLFFLWKFYLKNKLAGRLRHFLIGMKEGLLAIKNIKQKGLFIAHSLFIWLMYYLMLYVSCFCFEFTSHLTPLVGLTIFVLSSYGMVAPVQGGVGAWHFMVIAALMIYLPQVPNIESLSKAFALLTHSCMTLLYIFVGVICVIVLPIYNRDFSKK